MLVTNQRVYHVYHPRVYHVYNPRVYNSRLGNGHVKIKYSGIKFIIIYYLFYRDGCQLIQSDLASLAMATKKIPKGVKTLLRHGAIR